MHRILLVLSVLFSTDDTDQDRVARNEKRFAELVDTVLHDKNVDGVSARHALRDAGPDAFDYLLMVVEREKERRVQTLSSNPFRPLLATNIFTPPPIASRPYMLYPGANPISNVPLETPEIIDAVAGQKYAWASKLYWYTTEIDAKDRASREHKPIVSLRLLGKLTDERSCANSRFFRALLYPDPRVQTLLKNEAVLYWESVRDVPRITIELTPGQKIEQTITGNSIHYVMDEKGRLVDAIPGLYAPQEFAAALKQALGLARVAAPLNESEFRKLITETHTSRVRQAEEKLHAKLQEIKDRSTIANLIVNSPKKLAVDQITPLLTADTWELMAEGKKVDFDPRAQGLIDKLRGGRFGARKAGELSLNKFGGERPMLNLLASLSASVAADTLQNELSLRPAISKKFLDNPIINDLRWFNNSVYADVFLTPLDDRTMGLGNPDRFVALPNGGWTN